MSKSSKSNYQDYLKTQHWERMRSRVIQRDLGMCQATIIDKTTGKERLCLSRDKREVHHLTYARRGHEDLGDLITLCHLCHKAAHRKQPTSQQPTRLRP